MADWESLNRRIERCEHCPRLRDYCRQVARQKRRAFVTETYWGRPVRNFGDRDAQLLIVGLAPAAHGANRTGRMFTGDRSGEWVYRALHKAGFANQPDAVHRADGLELVNCAITAVCHCAPPDNKPTPEEISNCERWLHETIDLVPVRVFVAFGQIAWDRLVRIFRQRSWLTGNKPRFCHRACLPLAENRWLVGSYHPSQQNTFTGRLTEPMFDSIFQDARELLAK